MDGNSTIIFSAFFSLQIGIPNPDDYFQTRVSSLGSGFATLKSRRQADDQGHRGFPFGNYRELLCTEFPGISEILAGIYRSFLIIFLLLIITL